MDDVCPAGMPFHLQTKNLYKYLLFRDRLAETNNMMLQDLELFLDSDEEMPAARSYPLQSMGTSSSEDSHTRVVNDVNRGIAAMQRMEQRTPIFEVE